ncbi:MAG: Gfo/Idh/MocA family oxidoreductase [Pirellulaceae bacterium]
MSDRSTPLNVAFLGCGYVAEFYALTMPHHARIKLRGAFDLDAKRCQNFGQRHNIKAYASFQEMLDDDIQIVTNLTNPHAHFDTTTACLNAGKHVYTEKPMGLTMDEAKAIVALAEEKQLKISSAPCTLLGECAQTFWKALREESIGKPLAVDAELCEGFFYSMPYEGWKNPAGDIWPAEDEIRVGCGLEHLGYQLTWLLAFFGPATEVLAQGSCLATDKQKYVPAEEAAPDHIVASLRFQSGVTARITCSVIAPYSHALKIIGDQGVMSTKDVWHFDSPVKRKKMINFRGRSRLMPVAQKVRMARQPRKDLGYKSDAHQIDFALGIAELGDAILENRMPRLTPQFVLHVNEVLLAIHHSFPDGRLTKPETTFEPLSPMDWAR